MNLQMFYITAIILYVLFPHQAPLAACICFSGAANIPCAVTTFALRNANGTFLLNRFYIRVFVPETTAFVHTDLAYSTNERTKHGSMGNHFVINTDRCAWLLEQS
jgi:hypothetical protein